MKKIFKIEELYYSNCALKIKNKIKEFENVNKIFINFLIES